MKEYRAVWQVHGSKLEPLQLGRVETSYAMAELQSSLNGAAGLRADGCRVWIECREVGSWFPAPAHSREEM